MKIIVRMFVVLLSIFFLSGATCVKTHVGPTYVGTKHELQTKSGKKPFYYSSESHTWVVFDTKNHKPGDLDYIEHFKTYEEAEAKMFEIYGKPAHGTPVGGCFTADTLVLTKHGAKRIADVAPGDKILTYNSQGEVSTSQVSEALRFKNDHYFMVNKQIKVTKMHRFFTKDGWKRVRDLQIGDVLQKSDGTFEAVFSKELVRIDISVYNLEIKNDHNFFVSSNGKSGYLVHNCGGGGK